MATTTMLTRRRTREIRTGRRLRLGLVRRPPQVDLPATVATSNQLARLGLVRVGRPAPPLPAGRGERELADLMREILPEES